MIMLFCFEPFGTQFISNIHIFFLTFSLNFWNYPDGNPPSTPPSSPPSHPLPPPTHPFPPLLPFPPHPFPPISVLLYAQASDDTA